MWAKTDQEMDFSAWDEGQPDNGRNGTEDCLLMHSGIFSENRLWFDAQCYGMYGKPMCQIFPL